MRKCCVLISICCSRIEVLSHIDTAAAFDSWKIIRKDPVAQDFLSNFSCNTETYELTCGSWSRLAPAPTYVVK